MKRWNRALVGVLVLFSLLLGAVARAAPEQPTVDLRPRLQEIYDLRAQWLLTGLTPVRPIESDYSPTARTAKWSLEHEHGKFRYMKQWAENRGLRVVEAQAEIHPVLLKQTADRARFYVGQSLFVGYLYPGENSVNRFGVGTRHVVELRKTDGRWLIHMEWYTDPLGDDTEVPEVMPATAPGPLPEGAAKFAVAAASPGGVEVARRPYDRDGAVEYADTYCGLAAGCGNSHKYNPRFRDYSGVGGNCTNYVSQALREGGGIRMPLFTRVENLAGWLQYSGRADVTFRGGFQDLWKRARNQSDGFHSLLKKGDLFAYQEKGKMAHFAIVTGFDTRGYPLVNSHTADRYHVPFDLGWDRKVVYWLFRMRD